MERFFRVFVASAFLLMVVFGGMAALASTSLVLIHGKSMEPVYHEGDVVIAMKQPDYKVGDIVTYFNDSLGRYVIHRIVGKQDGYFTLKGDNNAWVDGYHPAAGSILGKSLVHIPQLGRLYSQFRLVFLRQSTGFIPGN